MTFTGSSGNDVITTSNGNDTIYGGAGNDALGGGDGDDIIYDLLGATVSIFAGAGDDSIFLGSTFTSGTVGGDTGADQLTVSGNISGLSIFRIETLNTGGGAVTATAAQLEGFNIIRYSAAPTSASVSLTLSAAGTIDLAGELQERSVNFTGSSGDDDITTSDGDDTITAGDGDDIINGGAGNDTLSGGEGDDIIVDVFGTATSIFAGAGDDQIFLGPDFLSGTVGGGDGADEITLNGGDISGLSIFRIETLNTSGAPVIATAAQFESFNTIRFSAGSPFDVVTLALAAAGTVDLAGELQGVTTNFFGSSGDDVITLSDGDDLVIGDEGDDVQHGGAGSDLFAEFSDDGRDYIDGGSGDDVYYMLEAGAYQVLTRAQALAAGITGLNALTEVVVTMGGVTSADIMAELKSVEFVQIEGETILDVSTLNVNAPAFLSSASATIAEGTTLAYTAHAISAFGGAITYSLSGLDSGAFQIDSATGDVTFDLLPDYEDAFDTGHDNIYDIVVTATDGAYSIATDVNITISNLNDNNPVFTTNAAETIRADVTLGQSVENLRAAFSCPDRNALDGSCDDGVEHRRDLKGCLMKAIGLKGVIRSQTQGKSERWHQTLKNRNRLKTTSCPVTSKRTSPHSSANNNHQRYHESQLGNRPRCLKLSDDGQNSNVFDGWRLSIDLMVRLSIASPVNRLIVPHRGTRDDPRQHGFSDD